MIQQLTRSRNLLATRQSSRKMKLMYIHILLYVQYNRVRGEVCAEREGGEVCDISGTVHNYT